MKDLVKLLERKIENEKKLKNKGIVKDAENIGRGAGWNFIEKSKLTKDQVFEILDYLEEIENGSLRISQREIIKIMNLEGISEQSIGQIKYRKTYKKYIKEWESNKKGQAL